MKVCFALIALSIVFLSYGCQSSIFTLTNEEHSYQVSDVKNIKLTTMEKIEGDFTEVGYVYAWGSSLEESIKNLKEQAAKIGGTNVIKFQASVIRDFIYIIVIPIPTDHYYCQGIVVKSNNLTGGI
jgi:hypothetical protein